MEQNSKILQWKSSAHTKELNIPFQLLVLLNRIEQLKGKINLIKAERALIEEAKLSTYFWVEAVSTACFTQNGTLINKHGITPYQIMKVKKPIVKFFHVFGCKFFVLRTHPEQLGKFEAKDDEGILLDIL